MWEGLVSSLIDPKSSGVVTNIFKFHKPSFDAYFEDQNGILNGKMNGNAVPTPLWFTDQCKSLRYTALSESEHQLILDANNKLTLAYADYFASTSFSDFHYCIRKPEGTHFPGKVAVIIDRFGYSSNDQLVTSIKAGSAQKRTGRS
ncbi:MAG: hypothetical protein NDJ89_00780 [Oligoflexia bacterium]|nr:hypothetical protein [Oligoflexia bacterium]